MDSKTLRYITAIIGILIFFGCKKKPVDLPAGMSAAINGAPWAASVFESKIDSPGHIPILYVQGYDSVKTN